jgi:oligosaccharide repeat unit polymerase
MDQIIKSHLYLLLITYNALISLIFILFSYKIGDLFFFFSLFVFGLILIHNTKNILFFIRTFFLGIIGYIAMGAKLISDDALFGYHMRESQTVEIATLMFLLTNIALFGSEIGFLFSQKVKLIKEHKLYFENKLFFYFVSFLLFIVASLMVLANGSLVITGGTYADGSGTSMPINNLNVFANILFYTLILLFYKIKNIYNIQNKRYLYVIIFFFFYIFFFAEFLRGVRMDALNGIFGFVILYLLYNDKPLKVTPKLFFLGIILFIIMQIMGMLRSALNYLTFDEIIAVIKNGFSEIIEGSKSGILFYQGTINDIATTFSGTIYMIQNHITDYYYGSSYFDYILRTPPKFLYPDRPEDLSWIFVNNGLTSGGGFFELAEAYLNFGVVGVFIVPFFISFFLGYAYKLFVNNKYSIYYSILLFSFLSGFMRGLLYQSFTFYKAIVTGFIIYMILYFIMGVLHTRKKVLA